MSSNPIPISLDVFTVKVMALITVLIVSAAALLAWRINRQVAGLRPFALGVLSIAVGATIALGRVVVPGEIVIVSGNVLMLGGLMTVVQGIRAFRGLPVLRRFPVTVFLVVVASLFSYWRYVHDDFGMRVAWMSSAFALLSIDASVAMFRGVPARDRVIFWPTGFSFAFTALYQGARAAGAFSGLYGSGFLAPVPLEVATTICANIAFVACVMGMLLACNTQLRYEAQKLALFDPLTNLPNRRYILDRLLDAERRTRTAGGRFGIIYLDLDGFKAINDTHGHAAGDDLLRRVSDAMSGALRASDCLGRIGGDEFIVLAEQVESRNEIQALADRLKSVVESEGSEGEVSGIKAVRIRISCGTAIFPDDGRSAHDVMREADVAMYLAKRQGRSAATVAVAV